MGNILNSDFTDFIDALNQARVDYILVGGFAVIFHGYNRTTGDLDVWVNPTEENYIKLKKAFEFFGMPMFDMTLQKFLNIKEFDVFTFGKSPVQIEVLTKVKGLEFETTLANSSLQDYDGVLVQMIDLRDLKEAKRAAGRAKDLADLENL